MRPYIEPAISLYPGMHYSTRGTPTNYWFPPPGQKPLYVRIGTVSAIDNTLVQLTFVDGSVSAWIPFDETARMKVGQLRHVEYQDAAMTKPYPFWAR